MTEAFIAAVAVLALATFFYWYAKARAEDAKLISNWQKEFYDRAQKLVDDKDTPDLIVGGIEVLSNNLLKTGWQWIFLVSHLTGKLAERLQASRGVTDLTSALDQMRSETRQLAQELFVLHLLINTYWGGLIGMVVRRTVVDLALRQSAARPYKLPKLGYTFAPEAIAAFKKQHSAACT